MDFNKLSTGMKLVLVGGALTLVAIFMPWFRVSLGPFGSVSANAFSSGFWAWAGCLLVVAGAAVLLVKELGTSEVKAGGFGTEQIAFFAAAAGLVFMIIRFVTMPSASGLGGGAGAGMGLFMGLIGGGLVAYGAFTVMKDAGMDFKPQQPQQPQQPMG